MQHGEQLTKQAGVRRSPWIDCGALGGRHPEQACGAPPRFLPHLTNTLVCPALQPHLTSTLVRPALNRCSAASFSSGDIWPCSRPRSAASKCPSATSRSASAVAALTSSCRPQGRRAWAQAGHKTPLCWMGQLRALAARHVHARSPGRWQDGSRAWARSRSSRGSACQTCRRLPLVHLPGATAGEAPPRSPLCHSLPQRGRQCRCGGPVPSRRGCAHTSGGEEWGVG